jgi:hypothetical protein
MADWADIDAELAAFGAERLAAGPCYLATVADDDLPRVHPVTPFVGEGRLWVFMEPTSPKGRDVQERHGFALHTSVPDNAGTGGEFLVRGTGRLVEDAEVRARAAAACPYKPADRYVLYELSPVDARSVVYGGGGKPVTRRWSA